MTDIPKTQKAVVIDGVNSAIEVREIAVPEPEHDEILVRLCYSGVCHSDLHAWKGECLGIPMKFPLVLGHEGAGVAAKLGSAVKGYKVGEKIGIKCVNGCCLSCEFCKQGMETSCTSNIISGYTRDGTYQQFCLVKAHDAIRIPDSIDLKNVAPIFCAGITVYRGLKETNLVAGKTVAIVGAGGGLGTLAIQYARAMGLRVLAIDVPAKEKLCKELGAEMFASALSPNLVAEVVEMTAGGPHAALNVANVPKVIEQSIQFLRPRGTAVLIAMPNASIKIDMVPTVLKVLTIKASLIGNRNDADEALSFVTRGLVHVPHEIITINDIPKTYERMEKGEINGRCIIDLWKI